MRTILFAMMVCATMTVTAQNNDSVDVCQFVVAYDYRINTFDKHGAAVVDSMRLAVLVGTKGTKCMDFYKAMSDDFDDYRNREWWEPEYAQRIFNIPVWCVNYPEGEMTTFDKVNQFGRSFLWLQTKNHGTCLFDTNRNTVRRITHISHGGTTYPANQLIGFGPHHLAIAWLKDETLQLVMFRLTEQNETRRKGNTKPTI